jgi:multidrug resistance efflux pump
VLATEFNAQVDALEVVEGSEVKKEQLVARLKSQSVDETLAKLSSEITNAVARRTAFSIRQRVIAAVRTSAANSFQAAHENRLHAELLIPGGLVSSKRIWESIDTEFKSGQALAELDAELIGIKQDLPLLESTIREASLAREQLKASYNEGRVFSPVDGIVGYLPVRKGSVARIGEPLMEIFTGEPYVLAFVPEGAFFTPHVGDEILLSVGLSTYRGYISRKLPVTAQLPKEFQDTIRPPARARVIHIKFAEGQEVPTLFAKPKISSASWWRLLLSSDAQPSRTP